MKELLEENFEYIISCVSCDGLDDSWLVQKIDEGGGSGFKCAYCDERVILGELKEQEEGQDTPILPWQMEYRTCLNPRVPHIFHTKCVRGLKAPHRKKHEVCVCCQQCIKEKNFDS